MISDILCLAFSKISGIFMLPVFFFVIACSTVEKEYPADKIPLVNNNTPLTITDSFDVKLQIDQLSDDEYNLSAIIELDSGDYIISPYSLDTFYMHFNMSIEGKENFLIKDSLLEIPPSVEEFDAILEEPVRFVRTNTTYQQTLKLLTQNDFETSGLITFLLEPSCVPYHVEFIISYQSERMSVEKIGTEIPSYYWR